jgi:hypothetical protein
MAGLHPTAARAAAANMQLVAGHKRPGRRQVLDMLDRDPLQHQLPAAAGQHTGSPTVTTSSTRSGGRR